jgi:acetylornithine deacetylase/succinyl-diaminopimelate desuccinylase-like protein
MDPPVAPQDSPDPLDLTMGCRRRCRRRWDGPRLLVLAGLTSAVLTAPEPAAAQLQPDRIRSMVERRAPQALELFREYLALPNDAHYPQRMEPLMDWVDGAFAGRRFETEWLTTPGLPLLLAHRRVSAPVATVLVYLQADGQPVDPGAWAQDDPYRAVLRAPDGSGGFSDIPWSRIESEIGEDWRIFARSASDSKGPNIQFLMALDLLEEAGLELDYDLKVIIDFEEELGSPNLPDAVERYRERLAADMLVIFDGPPHYSGAPSLKFGARGIATFTLTTYGPRVPQHSGHYGNYAPNPGMRLAQLLASMKDQAGRVVIPGFYDGIELDAETRRILGAVPDDEAEVQDRLGIAEPDHVGTSLQEAVQYPSLNVRGLASAWVGDEVRTIVPSNAVAEVDVRLVRETEGERLLALIRDHVEGQGFHVVSGRDPTDDERRMHPRLARFDGRVSYAAFRTDFDSPPGQWLDAGMRRLFQREPVKIRTSGGSIPISPFVATLGVPAVSVPTVNPDNNQHSPDENIRVGSFLEGIAIAVAVLGEPLRPWRVLP